VSVAALSVKPPTTSLLGRRTPPDAGFSPSPTLAPEAADLEDILAERDACGVSTEMQ